MLLEQLEQKNISVEKLSLSTGVPERFINVFLSTEEPNPKTLPSAPYVRGYLKKISQALDLNTETIWQTYIGVNNPRQSGQKDQLPQNRFAIQSINKKTLILGFAGSLFLIYAIFNIGRILTKPSISIIEPVAETTTTNYPSFYLKGAILNANDILTVNGATIYINESGEFNREFSLTPGTNSFEVIVKRFLGRETRLTRQVIYEPSKETVELKKPSQ